MSSSSCQNFVLYNQSVMALSYRHHTGYFRLTLKFLLWLFFLKIIFHCLISFYNKFDSCNLFEILFELKPLVTVCSKISTASLEVGSAIITRDISLSIQPLSVLAELHFLGLKPYWSCMNWNLFSAISQSIMTSWALYKSFISPKFHVFNVLYKKKEPA